jgi:hypothetical protein
MIFWHGKSHFESESCGGHRWTSSPGKLRRVAAGFAVIVASLVGYASPAAAGTCPGHNHGFRAHNAVWGPWNIGPGCDVYYQHGNQGGVAYSSIKKNLTGCSTLNVGMIRCASGACSEQAASHTNPPVGQWVTANGAPSIFNSCYDIYGSSFGNHTHTFNAY